jgi:hypothetical protein
MSLSSKVNYSLEALSGITVGNINITGNIYQNNNPYIASQWTSTSGNALSYTSGNVIISSGALLVSELTTGNINFTGTLYQNGAPYVGSQWTTTSGNLLTYTSGNVRISNGTLYAGGITAGILYANNSRVGINTTSPLLNFDIRGSSFGIRQSDTSPWDHLYFLISSSSASIRSGGAESGLFIDVASGSGYTYGNTAYTSVATFTSRGNVGIGNTSPSFNLDVTGTGNITTSLTTGALYSTNLTTTNIVGTSITASNINVSGTLTVVNITSTNLIDTNISAGTLVGTSVSVASLSASSSTLANSFVSGGLGIGTTNPNTSYNLDVAGSIRSGLRLDIGGNQPIYSGNTLGRLFITGAQNSVTAGPNILITTSQDSFPTYNFLTYGHDSSWTMYDMYFDGSSFRNSGTSTAFAMLKDGSTLKWNYNSSGFSAGAAAPMSTSICIGSGGNVGLGGQVTPVYTLDVSGGARIISGITAGSSTFTTVSAGDSQFSNLSTGNINFTGSLFQNGSAYIGSQWVGTSGSIYYGTAGSSTVGINTTAPGTTLDVSGTGRITTSLTSGALYSTNLTTTNVVGTRISAGNFVGTTISTTNMYGSTGTISNFVGTNLSGSTLNISSTGRITTSLTTGALYSTNQTTTNIVATNISSSTLNISSPTNATSVSNGGALTVVGGAAVGGDLIVGGSILYSNAAAASSTFAYLTLTASDWSTDIANGSLVVYGGISVQNTANAVSATEGNGLTIAGGAGIGADLYVGGKANIPNVVSSNISSGTLNVSTGITSNNIYLTGDITYSTNNNYINIPDNSFIRVGADQVYKTHMLVVGDNYTDAGGRIVYRFSRYTSWEYINGVSGSPQTKMTLVSSGNLGIGTTSPVTTLDVSGTGRITTSLTTGALYSTNQTTTNIVATSSTITNLNIPGTLTVVNITSTNLVETNITTSALLSTNINTTTSTIATLLNTDTISTNISSGTITATTYTGGIVSVTSITTGTIRVTGNADLSTGLTTVTDLTGTNITSGTIRASTLISTSNLSTNNFSAGTIRATTLITTSNLSTNTSTIATLLNTNSVSTNISSGTLNLSTGITSASAQITNLNATISTIATLLNTNAVSTNISSGTLTLSTGITSASAQITNLNVTNATVGALLNTDTISTNISSGTITATTYTGGIVSVTSITTGTIRVTGNADLSTGLTTVTDLTGTNITSGTIRASTLISTSNLSTNIITAGTSRITTSLVAIGNSNTLGNIFTTNGNVGIGTTSPSSLLHLFSNSNTRINIDAPSSANSGFSLRSGGVEKSVIWRPSNTDDFAIWMSGTNSNTLYIKNTNGNIGIGTTNPSFTLDVNGTIDASTYVTTGALYSTNQTTTNIVATASTITNLSIPGTLTVVNITSTNLVETNITAATIIVTGGSLNATFNSNTIGSIFTTGGNVGINTLTPSAPLHITRNVGFGSVNPLITLTALTGTDIGPALGGGSVNLEVGESGGNVTTYNAGKIVWGSIDSLYGPVGEYNGLIIIQTANNRTLGNLLTLTGNQRVGINTTNPGFDLDVNGTIDAITYTGANLAITSATAGTMIANDSLSIGGISSFFTGSFSANNNVASASNVTGLLFPSASVRSFVATLNINVSKAGGNLNEMVTLEGVQGDSGWILFDSSLGEDTGLVFTIDSTGQVQYTSINHISWTSTTIRFEGHYYTLAGTYIPTALPTTGNVSITGDLSISSTKDATNTSSGALTVLGGAGVSKSLLVGQNLNVGGVSNTFTGSFAAANNVAAATNVTGFLVPTATFSSFTASVNVRLLTTTTTLNAQYLFEATQTTSGWLLNDTSLGDSVGLTFTITSAGQIQYTSTNVANWQSTTINYSVTAISISTGFTAVLPTSGSVTISGNLTIDSTTDSSSTSSASLVLAGGAGINKSLLVGGNFNIGGVTTQFAGTFSAANGVSGATFTGLSFPNATIRSFTCTISIRVVSNVNYNTQHTIDGIQTATGGWQISDSQIGDASGITFAINSAGQITYTSPTFTTWTSTTMHYNAVAYNISSSYTPIPMPTGGSSSVAGSLVIQGTDEASSTSSGALSVSGGVNVQKNLIVADNFFVTSAGNVGIGTSSPQRSLHVAGQFMRLSSGSGASYGEFFVDNSAMTILGKNSGSLILKSQGNWVDEGVFIQNTNGSTILSALQSGNVGIATTAPAYTLDINGNLRAIGNAFLTSTTSIFNTVNTYSLTSGALNVTGDIVLSGSELMFTQTGVAVPTMNGRSAGTKMVLYPGSSASTGDYAIGIETNNTWFQVPNSNSGYKFYQGTTSSMVIATGGNVGIGTTAPSSNLTISTNGAGPQVAMYPQSNGGETSMSFYNNNIASGNTTRWVAGHNVTVGIGNFGFWNSSFNAPVMALTSTGNVGIGTTAPATSLHVSQSGGTASMSIQNRSSTGNSSIDFFNHGGSYIGSVGFGNTSSSSGTQFGNKLFLYHNNQDAVFIGSSTTERMRITASGNVGIGNTAPAYTLDVNGTARFSNGITGIPHFNYFTSAAQNVAYPNTALTGGSVVVDNASGFNSTTGKYTIPRTGVYCISYNVRANDSTIDQAIVWAFTRSGSTTSSSDVWIPRDPNNRRNASFSRIINMIAGDLVFVTNSNNSVNTLNLGNVDMSIYMISV